MLRKLTASLLILLVLLVVTLTLIVPFVARLQLEAWMKDQGAVHAKVQSIRLNPFTGSVSLAGLYASGPNGPDLRLGLVKVDLNYAELLQKKLLIDQLYLHDLRLPLTMQGKQLHIGPLQIPASTADASDTDAQEPAQPSTWRVGLNTLRLNSIDIDARLDQQHYHLHVRRAHLLALQQWNPEQLSQIVIQGRLNQHPFSFNSQAKPLADVPVATSRLTLDGLQLEPLRRPFVPGLAGTVSADLQLTFEQQGQQIALSQTGSISLTDLKMTQDASDLGLKTLSWQGNNRIALTDLALTGLNNTGKLSIKGLSLKQATLQLQSDAITWQGDADMRQPANRPDNGLDLQQRGVLALDNLALTDTDLQSSIAAIRWQGQNNLNLRASKPQQISNSGTLDITTLKANLPELSLDNRSLVWSGDITLTDVNALSVKGELNNQAADVRLPNLRATQAQVHWQGELSSQLSPFSLETLQAALSTQGTQLVDTENKTLLTLNTFSGADIRLLPKHRYQVSDLSLSDLSIDGQTRPLLTLARAHLDTLAAGPDAIAAGTLALSALEATMILDDQRQPTAWQAWVQRLVPTDPTQTTEQPAPQTQEPAAPLHITLTELIMAKPSSLHFRDEAAKPVRDHTIVVNTLSLRQVDNQSHTPSPFTLEAAINNDAKLTLSGDYALFADKPSGRWQATLQHLELPPFSGYVETATGYQLASGQFNLASNGTLTTGKLKSESKATFNKLRVETVDADSAALADKKIGIPLTTAVSILTDDDDNVILTIPVQGDLSDPEFGYQSVVNVLMGKVIKESAMGYLAVSLQPYGALLALGRMAVKAGKTAGVNLQPVVFPPGSHDLDTQAKAYLDTLSNLLSDRQGIRLTLCGKSTHADRLRLNPAPVGAAKSDSTGMPNSISKIDKTDKTDNKNAENKDRSKTPPAQPMLSEHALDAQLLALAQRRGEQVKQYLQQHANIGQDRLFSCPPRIIKTDAQRPSVVLGF